MPIACHVVHAVRGRARLRLPALKQSPPWKHALEAYLLDQDGVAAVRLSEASASAIVEFDAARLTPSRVASLVRGLSPEELTAYERRQTVRQSSVRDSAESGFELVLSTAGVLVSVLVEPLAPLLLPLLLLGSALPVASRAFDAFAGEGKLNVDTLDASAVTLLVLQGDLRMAVGMLWLVNLGDYIRDATVRQAKGAMADVLSYRSCPAWVLRDGEKVCVPAGEVVPGDTVVVYPGERIPVDGVVTSGRATVSQQTLTGESLPVEKSEGGMVYAATVVQDGKLYVRAQQVGEGTEVAKMIRLVEQAPMQETRIQNYAERWADALVPYSFLGAGLCGIFGGTLSRAASVLIIDYGTGIRIAAPTTVLAALAKAARRGIFIKGGRYLEQLAAVDAVVFDKTGTLTAGEPEVLAVVTHNGYGTSDVLRLAAASEQRLTHPVAKAIVRAAEARGLDIPDRTRSEYSIGLGVESVVNGSLVQVGCPRFLARNGLVLSPALERDLRDLEDQAYSPVCVGVDGEVAGLLGYADPLRPEAPGVVQSLRKLGISEIVMLTGDRRAVADQVAEQVGIETYVAEALPADKVEYVKRLQREGRTVAVVGDGINDSPALAHADVGIALDGGSEAAQETAAVVLLHGALDQVREAVEISREAVALIHQNWRIISIPNTVALGLALFGLLGPAGTTVLSNGSAVLATGNALRPLLGDTGSRRKAGSPPARAQKRARRARSSATSATDLTRNRGNPSA